MEFLQRTNRPIWERGEGLKLVDVDQATETKHAAERLCTAGKVMLKFENEAPQSDGAVQLLILEMTAQEALDLAQRILDNVTLPSADGEAAPQESMD